MMNHEPKCIQWKRQGAEKVAALTVNMSREQELEFWRKKTELLRTRQASRKKEQEASDHAGAG